MKKILCLILSVSLLTIFVAGCGETAASYNINDVMDTVAEAVKLESPVDANVDDFVLEYGVAAEDIEEFTGKVTNVNGEAGMIYIIKAKPGKASDIKTILEGVRDANADFLGNYPEFEAAQKIASAGRCVLKGDYVALVVGCDKAVAETDGVEKAYEAVDKAIDEAFK